ncbi:DUF2516 family protein [Rhizohabitans arisaemae]|uniref:DUF2516 family protein n=1 Tax=Rhizohabitans arisaemae TaxID=2720610 RepID=UPI0024B20D7F|nr:DUF2516 family protein [Rhizohabitans arisaemae]
MHDVLDLIFWFLAIAVFGFAVWALIDAARRPAQAFAYAGKQTKQIWLIILGFATLFGLAAAVQYISALSIFTIAAVIATTIYRVDVWPAVKQIGKGGSSSW